MIPSTNCRSCGPSEARTSSLVARLGAALSLPTAKTSSAQVMTAASAAAASMRPVRRPRLSWMVVGMVVVVFIEALLSWADDHGGDDPVEVEACVPVHGRDSRGGRRIELAEAGLVLGNDRRAEVAHLGVLAPGIVCRVLQLLKRSLQLSADEAWEVSLDDVDHAVETTA